MVGKFNSGNSGCLPKRQLYTIGRTINEISQYDKINNKFFSPIYHVTLEIGYIKVVDIQ
jgi:hypothetical protein